MNAITFRFGSLTVLATGLIDHAEAIVAIVHVGEQQQEIAGGLLGLVELGSANQVHYGVGGDNKRILVSIFLLGFGEAGGDCCRQLGDLQAICGGALVASQRVARRLGFDKQLARDRFLLGKAAFLVLVAAAARAGIITSGLGHCGQHLRAEELPTSAAAHRRRQGRPDERR
jgi:hypothetical protein